MRAAAPFLLAALVLAVTALPAGAQAPYGTYTPCDPVGEASIVSVSGAPCDAARAVALALIAAPPDVAPTVLAAAGWSPLRALPTEAGTEHDLVALRPGVALRIRRPGTAPDVDGWAAGRELLFARPRLVGGAPVPDGATLCTSAFLVRLPGGRVRGLSAAHCAGLRRDKTVQRRYAALRRPPLPGIVLGRVERNLTRTRPLDALVLPVPTGPARPASAVVDRGVDLPPWSVTGPGQATARRRVCLTGRTSGPDRCGRILAGVRRAERALSVLAGAVVRCTSIRAREGDSGGPVYTAPRPDGSVRAVGIATLVVGPSARMCFTPLSPVLDALNARLVTAPR